MSKQIDIYHVDNDVPIPVTVEVHTAPVPLSRLEPGQSILFPLAQRYTVQTQASRLKRQNGKVFTIRKVSDTEARVWRVE